MITAEINTQFARIKLSLGPDTLKVTVRRDDVEVAFNLTQYQADFLADTFSMWSKRLNDRKI